MVKDYYSILELSEEDKKLKGDDFTKKLKANYRKICKQVHPDKFANKSESERKEAEEKFKEVTEAYDVLSNPQKRQQYDQFGQVGEFDFNGFGMTGMEEVDEILRRFRNGAGFNPFNPFGSMGGFGQQNHTNNNYTPQPLKIKVHVTIDEIYNSKVKKIRYKKFVPCTHCNGVGLGKNGKMDTCPVCKGSGSEVHIEQRGWMTTQTVTTCSHCHGTGEVVVNPCQHCNGSGREVTTTEIEIPIPNGVTNEAMMRIPGAGHCAERHKNIIGDLIVLFIVEPDEHFSIVNQYDLYTEIEIPILDCLTGCNREIKHFNNKKVSVTIPKLTKEGTILKLSNMGLPNGDNRGNLLIRVKQKYPKNISESDERTLNELKKSKNFK